MEIYVEGVGKTTITPDQVSIFLNFNLSNKSYETAVQNGTNQVAQTTQVLKTLGFDAKQIKTRTMRVDEDKIYDDRTRSYISNDFTFRQTIILTFDYDLDKITKLIEAISHDAFAPTYKLQFGIKDNLSAQEKVLKLAYQNAETQANIIAAASGAKIKCCKKISFQPFENAFLSTTDCAEMRCYSNAVAKSIQSNIVESFTPEDIEIRKSLFCIFETE